MGISQEAAKMKVHRAKSILAKKIAGMRKEGDFEMKCRYMDYLINCEFGLFA